MFLLQGSLTLIVIFLQDFLVIFKKSTFYTIDFTF